MWSFSTKFPTSNAQLPSGSFTGGRLGCSGPTVWKAVRRCKPRPSCHASASGNGVPPVANKDVANRGGWMAMNEPLVWKGNEKAFMKAAAAMKLPPAVKLLLLSDGSMTKHISLLMAEEVVVKPLGEPHAVGLDDIPELCKYMLKGPILQREVFLTTESSKTLIYAASWWNEDTMASFFTSWDEAVGSQILSRRIETHREIDQVYLGDSTELSGSLGEPGPFWGRLYVLWSGNAPMCIIHEVLSNRLLERAGTDAHIQRLKRMNGKGFHGNGTGMLNKETSINLEGSSFE